MINTTSSRTHTQTHSYIKFCPINKCFHHKNEIMKAYTRHYIIPIKESIAPKKRSFKTKSIPWETLDEHKEDNPPKHLTYQLVRFEGNQSSSGGRGIDWDTCSHQPSHNLVPAPVKRLVAQKSTITHKRHNKYKLCNKTTFQF